MKKLFALVLVAAAAFAAEGYHVLNKIKIGGTGGWDYIAADGANHRLYVSHGVSVAIVDTGTGGIIGTVADLHGVHGIAVAAELNKGFISNGQSNSVTVFDLSTFAKTAEIQTGQNPDAICYEPKTQRVFTFNGRSADSTAIDAKSNAVLATFALSAGSRSSALPPAMARSTTIWKTNRKWWRSTPPNRRSPAPPSSTRATAPPAWRSIPRMACCFPSAAIK